MDFANEILVKKVAKEFWLSCIWLWVSAREGFYWWDGGEKEDLIKTTQLLLSTLFLYFY